MRPFHPSSEQAAVIAAPLDSLRVSAGAGTGKTATVAARVAALVTDHGVDPAAIVGLTFTNKAAEELAERIRLHLGGNDTVEVLTYHGFAAAILREFGIFVGVGRDVRILTPAYARQLASSVLAAGTFDRFDPTRYRAVDDVLDLAAGIGEHLLDPARVPPGPGDTGEVRAELLAALTAYTAEKRRLGMVDYGDLVARAWELASGRPEVAEAIRGRYRAVVLDEYQDTSPAQRELLRTLFAGRVPVMAVGDPDQTIYEWRGASAENFAAFPADFPAAGGPAPTLVLSLNRRSGEAVLAVGNAVRGRIDDEPRPALTPLPDAPRGRVVAHWGATAADEADWIAATAERLHADGRRWGDMAVLFRKNKDMALVHEALARRDIPFEVANLGGLLSVPEVVDIVSWLRVLHDPFDTPAFARLVLGSRLRLGLGDLAVLARGAARPTGDDDEPGSLVEALDDLAALPLRPAAAAALERFRAEYRTLLERAQASTLSDLTRAILDVTGAWSDVEAMSTPAALTARLNLYRLLDLTEEWSPLDGRPSLGAFLEYLRALDDEPSDAPDAARLSGEDAVVLLTVHRAKGLEWPVVFLPALYEGNFPARGRDPDPRTDPAALPFELRLDRDGLPGPDLDDEERKAALVARALRQEWRTAYVAVTRPQEELYVSGAWWYGHPEPHKSPSKRSELFTLVAGFAESDGDIPEPPPRPERLLDLPAPAPDPLFSSWTAALRETIADPAWPLREASSRGLAEATEAAARAHEETLRALVDLSRPPARQTPSTSVTGLVTYATCPKRYYWTEVDRLPRRPSPAARRGVDVHRRIELHGRGIVPLFEETGSAPAAPSPGADPFSVFRRSRFAAASPLRVEAPFDMTVGPLAVRGRVDAVYGDADRWEIVDFKSGRPTDDPARPVQLEVYALAAAGGALGPPPRALTVTFAYLGGGELVEETSAAEGDWLDGARRRVESLADGIASSVWDPSPSPACAGCDFLRFCPEGRSLLDRGGPS